MGQKYRFPKVEYKTLKKFNEVLSWRQMAWCWLLLVLSFNVYIHNEVHHSEDIPYLGSQKCHRVPACQESTNKTCEIWSLNSVLPRSPFPTKGNESFQNALQASDVELFILDTFLKAVITASG